MVVEGESCADRGCRRKWLKPVIVMLIIAAGGAGFYLFSDSKSSGSRGSAQAANAKGQQVTPVLAATARKSDVGVYLTGLGNVSALNTVSVKSRVDGQLMKVYFKEGQTVRKGELLATIDPRPFSVLLTQAEGQMARDRELLNNARIDLQRYKQLWQQDSIPKQQLDTQQALVRQLEGTVRIDQGQVDSARLQLSYSRITAPISGRVGLRQVDPGNMVKASDTNPLLVITQLQPITVIFPVPEDHLPKLLAKMKSNSRLAIDAYDREQKQKLASGTLLTMDNQIDPTTGTVKLKALFANSQNELFPNQFVNARLLVETMRDAIVIPTAAIQRGSQGTFVYLIKADKTVTVRPVKIGPVQNDETAIIAGLELGEQVVVDGAERLKEGSRVEVKEGNNAKNGAAGKPAEQGNGQAPGAHGQRPLK